MYYVLKSSRNKKVLNDVTVAQFSVSFSQLPAVKKVHMEIFFGPSYFVTTLVKLNLIIFGVVR